VLHGTGGMALEATAPPTKRCMSARVPKTSSSTETSGKGGHTTPHGLNPPHRFAADPFRCFLGGKWATFLCPLSPTAQWRRE
jgi:hypothetical protein